LKHENAQVKHDTVLTEKKMSGGTFDFVDVWMVDWWRHL